MMEYLTIEFSSAYGVSIQRARRLTEAEAANVRPEYRERTFVGLGDAVALKHLGWNDMPNRAPDGEFAGCGNRVYIITDDELRAFIQINAQRQAAEDLRNAEQLRAMYLGIVNDAERQGGAMTDAEAAQARKRYNDTYNEGGYGYVPHFVTHKELDEAKAWLANNQ